jgi:nitroreductase
METLEAIFNRRSIRDYSDVPVTDAEIEILLKSAFSAPTAVNTQPWEFVVINEKEVLDKIREKMLFARYNAPLGIVVCGNMKYALKSQDRDLWICDCGYTVQKVHSFRYLSAPISGKTVQYNPDSRCSC